MGMPNPQSTSKKFVCRKWLADGPGKKALPMGCPRAAPSCPYRCGGQGFAVGAGALLGGISESG